VANLARKLDMRSVAEGIETSEQLAALSTCRSFETISSALCLFLAIDVLLGQKPYFESDHFNGGGSSPRHTFPICQACKSNSPGDDSEPGSDERDALLQIKRSLAFLACQKTSSDSAPARH
jgi:hypothetical protein